MGDNAETPEGAPATSGSGTFDSFNTLFVRILVAVVWFAYAMPVIEKLINGKSSKWQNKIKSGWEYVKGGDSVKKAQ